MLFKLYEQQSDFDILTQPLPGNYLPHYFGDQLERARIILDKRSSSELSYAFESLDWILKEGSKHLLPIALEESSRKGRSFVNRVKALQAFMPHTDIYEQSHMQNATWPEYFALLAAANILEVMHEDNFGLTPDTKDYTAIIPSALESMEAICIAENLENTPKAIGQKGGKVRVAKFDELKTKIINEYEAHHTQRTNRQAAKLITKKFEQEINNTLSTDEPEHTLAKWIGQHKKNNK